MNFSEKLKAITALARVQAGLGGVFISNKQNGDLGHAYASLDGMLIQLHPFLAAERAALIQYRIQAPGANDEAGRSLMAPKELLVTAFVHLETGETIEDRREITVAPVNNIITSQILTESETYARKSALRCLFAAHDSETVPQSDARTLMTDIPASAADAQRQELLQDAKIAADEARIIQAINALVHNEEHEAFFKQFLIARKLDEPMEKFAIQYYAQAIKVPKAVKEAVLN
jgi:hypothetical protein